MVNENKEFKHSFLLEIDPRGRFTSRDFCFADSMGQEHAKVADDKKERNDKWDKHTRPRPGGEEKKKDEGKGWFRRKTPTKKRIQKDKEDK